MIHYEDVNPNRCSGMCTQPQSDTNSVAHMVNDMKHFTKNCIPNITIPFRDDIPIKGCSKVDKDETLDGHGCRHFMANHIANCDKILQGPEDAHMTFSSEKSDFSNYQRFS